MAQNETNERFVNPYNFVPLEEKCERRKYGEKSESKKRTLTGYLTCTLTTLTPLFIPNTSCNHALHKEEEKDSKHVSYNFYSYEDLSHEGIRKDGFYSPVIPGSEIRGTIRGVFEAAFNGCLSQVNKDEPLHRRSMRPKKPGLLHYNKKLNKWEIEPCERVMLNTTFDDKDRQKQHGKYFNFYEEGLREGDTLFIKKSKTKYKNKIKYFVVEDWCVHEPKPEGWHKGVLHIGEPFGNKKHHESVFIPLEEESRLPVPNEEIKTFYQLLHQYNDEKINKNLNIKRHPKDKEHRGYEAYINQKFQGEGRIPVYYSEYKLANSSQIVAGFLSPAILSKEVFKTKVGTLLQVNGDYQPCVSRDLVCPACTLFGLVSEKSGKSLASRVRFSDAKVEKEVEHFESYMKPVLLPEMGEPKPGTVEFYTDIPKEVERKEGKYWTYDYTEKNDQRFELQPNKLKIRGRKFYWHHSHDSLANKLSDGDLSEMKQRIRPLKAGNKFTFTVYFEQITEEELSRLCWALDFHNPDCAHKIGRGKPLGLGSVRIKIDELKLREIDRNSGVWHLQDTPVKKYTINNNTTSMDNMLKIARFEHPLKDKISYPRVTGGNQRKNKPNETASHQWFNKNNKNKKSFSKVLPTIEEELEKEDKKNKWLKVLKID
ncbi:TIGR03986 family CRISPR-associated RAMP protein [Siminovitchia sp. FSL W7-1587]|uniref:TIGR03986 family type III CRISPR-associated RAMP protein n=1 Tax=Siminovitchia sp. FSL W7-1587 TaxID=2954699 RepID=UPI0030D41648